MSDPVPVADDLWQRLIAHQPAVAAALALQLRDLPDDWPQRLLGITRPHAALELPATSGMPMEIQPYDTSDWESCLTCAEFHQLCRYHEGFATGYEALDGPLTDASLLDPTGHRQGHVPAPDGCRRGRGERRTRRGRRAADRRTRLTGSLRSDNGHLRLSFPEH
ncbi:hypothetical protein [Streptomyces sp. NPDC088180]|uniref:hypothetical protein n=1 Tax=Streptomyces sp. NPDC088180 TaxID=3365837 RepID=UPI00382AF47B